MAETETEVVVFQRSPCGDLLLPVVHSPICEHRLLTPKDERIH